MDPNQQQQHTGMPDDHNMVGGAAPYNFYAGGEADHNGFGVYNPMEGYAGGMVPPGMPPRTLSSEGMQPYMPMGLMPPHQIQTYNLYGAPPQHVGGMGMVGSPPASPSIYDTLSPPNTGSDTSGNEGHYHSRTHSGAASPASSSRRNSFVNRGALRYNPTPSPSSGSERRSRGRSLSEEDDEGMGIGDHHMSSQRKEATRKQRIEAEQKRRDELRDGYAKLKDVLPVSNAKSSKVSLLERATKHIVDMERRNDELSARLNQMESEVRRLRALNEKISLSAGLPPASPGSAMSGTRTPNGGSPMMKTHPLSPPPENESHSLRSVSGQDVPGEHSSGSDNGF